MSAALALALALTTRHGDRRFRVRPLTLVPDWRLTPRESPPVQIRSHRRGRDFTRGEHAAIERAVKNAGRHLSPERRWDLRQELALVLLEHDTSTIANLEAWLIRCAHNLLASEARDESRRREILDEAARLGAAKGYRKKGERRLAPGEQFMTLHAAPTFVDIEQVLVDEIDRRCELGIEHAQLKPNRRDEALRTLSDNSTAADRVRASSSQGPRT